MADTQQDSVNSGLKKVYVSLAQLKLAPDAQGIGGQFVDGLMSAIQKFLIQSAQQSIGGGQGGPAGAGGQPGGGMAAMMGGGGMGAPPPAAANAPGGGGGMTGLAQSPGNMDEMRRMLTSGSVNP